MASYTACTGTRENGVNLERRPGVGGLGFDTVPSKTYFDCPSCGKLFSVRGLVNTISTPRHKPQAADSDR